MKISATLYNYTAQDTVNETFPLNSEKMQGYINSGQEIMVDSVEGATIGGEVGMSLREFNEAAKAIAESGMTDEEFKILGKTYLFKEIYEKINDSYTIIDFYGETAGWASSDFYNEGDKGRILYDLGYASFPAEVPEELEEYMDYAMLYRDTEINLGIREVDGRYMVF